VLDGFELPYGILGDPRSFPLRAADVVLVALGSPAARREWVAIMESRGARFATLIHPTAVLGLRNEVGIGSIICPRVVLTTNVRVGRHVVFNCGGGAGHDVTIGDFCTLSGGVDLTGHVRLGEGVMVGSHASISPHADVGDWSTVGAGSVVIGKVPARTTVMGVPAVPVWGAGVMPDGT
jgi:sugar O-acyltransferase (sialic acid O-acetyltransferase NeuD family)